MHLSEWYVGREKQQAAQGGSASFGMVRLMTAALHQDLRILPRFDELGFGSKDANTLRALASHRKQHSASAGIG